MQQKEPMRRSTLILWGIVIQLWILNLVVLFFLNQARLTAIENLNKAETMLDKLANEVVSYDIQVNRPIPLKADIPFKQKLDIPINTVIPIDREIQVPFNTPAGDVIIDVPLKTDFPIDMVVPVDFNQTVNVDTVVQLDTTVPVEIAVAKTPLLGYLEQIKQDLVRLRSRLSFQSEAAAGEAAISLSKEAAIKLDTSPDQAEETSMVKTGSQSGDVAAAQTSPDELTATIDNWVIPITQGACAHPYWPLQVGVKWTYDSPVTSFTQQVDTMAANQVVLSSQYEGQTIEATLGCSQDGLGGNFLGDMRRISELGNLTFKATKGVFLAGPEIIEKLGASWAQEFEVSGTVEGSYADTLINGSITQGMASAIYTSGGFESLKTPLGPREALRIEQKFHMNLNIDFKLDENTIPATEKVDLTTTYWFVKDIGLAAVHWQGGSLQQNLNTEQIPVTNITIPDLPEDILVLICASSDQPASNCKQNADVSEAGLVAAASELDISGFILPEMAAGVVNNVMIDGLNNSADGDSSDSSSAVNADNPQNPQNDERAALLQYAAAINNLNERISDAAEDFGEAAIKFRDDLISLDEFKNKYADFAPKIRQLVRDLNGLKPPPLARNIHAKFTGGMAKCEQASNMLSQWFNSFDPTLKQAGTFLVADCVNQVTEASNELNQLVAANSSP